MSLRRHFSTMTLLAIRQQTCKTGLALVEVPDGKFLLAGLALRHFLFTSPHYATSSNEASVTLLHPTNRCLKVNLPWSRSCRRTRPAIVWP